MLGFMCVIAGLFAIPWAALIAWFARGKTAFGYKLAVFVFAAALTGTTLGFAGLLALSGR